MEYAIDIARGALFVIDTTVDRSRRVGGAMGLRFADHGVAPISAGEAGA
jgi:hypothetical protein